MAEGKHGPPSDFGLCVCVDVGGWVPASAGMCLQVLGTQVLEKSGYTVEILTNDMEGDAQPTRNAILNSLACSRDRSVPCAAQTWPRPFCHPFADAFRRAVFKGWYSYFSLFYYQGLSLKNHPQAKVRPTVGPGVEQMQKNKTEKNLFLIFFHKMGDGPKTNSTCFCRNMDFCAIFHVVFRVSHCLCGEGYFFLLTYCPDQPRMVSSLGGLGELGPPLVVHSQIVVFFSRLMPSVLPRRGGVPSSIFVFGPQCKWVGADSHLT